MTPQRLLSVAVVGATGSLGSELLAVLDERTFPVGELVPIATDRSLGREVEIGGETYPVQTEARSLAGVDLAFLCAPPAASLDWARIALSERVPAIDLSGALATQPDVDLLVADWLSDEIELERPLVAGPAGPALAFALVLAPLSRAAGLRRVVATTFEAASVDGRAGIEALSGQSIALFSQHDSADDEPGDPAVAFACLPSVGEVRPDGATAHEEALAGALARLLGHPLSLAATAVRVPTFSGDGAALFVETERPLAPEAAREALAKAPGIALFGGESGPATRASTGRDAVLVGRIREAAGGLLLWIAADALHLAAANGVKLAELRPLRRAVP
jgi:aspartate-semialdehyde dehydrogenase